MNISDLHRNSGVFSNTEKMPVLFLGHGSPMNAIEENQFVDGFRNIAKTLPEPNAIICISAHWYINGTKVTAMKMPRTIHDFGGFPRELYSVQYPAPGSPELALETKHLLSPVLVELDEKWGLDHGAWSVIKHLFPGADVPVIELSIDYSKSPEYHYALAKQLGTLRNKGILFVGSGNIVHNLGLVDWQNFEKDNFSFDWAIEAKETINRWLMDGDLMSVINYRKQSTAIQLAVPTPDHYIPLIYTLGLKDGTDKTDFFNDKMVAGSLSMTSLKFS
jgi:4,5-DOPA dioxygenase extradiol